MRSRRFARRRASERSISSIPACLPVVQTLVARKSESREVQFIRQVADHTLGAAIHRRGINDFAAELNETAEHFLERRSFASRIAHVESARRAEANRGDFLARGRNGALPHLVRRVRPFQSQGQERRRGCATKRRAASRLVIPEG